MCFVQLPHTVAALQRSVHGVLLGKVVRPDWITHGVPRSSQSTAFRLRLPPGTNFKTCAILNG